MSIETCGEEPWTGADGDRRMPGLEMTRGVERGLGIGMGRGPKVGVEVVAAWPTRPCWSRPR